MKGSAWQTECAKHLAQVEVRRTRTSEGTASARRLQGLPPDEAPSSRPMALDGLDLHRVHHVDTHDLEHGQGVSIGGTCLPPAFTRAPGAVTGDHSTREHDHGDAVLRRWAGLSLGLGLALFAVGAWLLAAG